MGIDSTHDRRSAYYFGINAAGVLRDGLFFGDVNLADTWDGVWDGAVAVRPDGWSAELAIPLDLLRFPRAQTQDWGFLVRRTVHRTHQVYDSTLVPRSANGLVSRFGTLTGLDGVTPRGAFQIPPYVTGRLSFRPQYTDPAYPEPRLTEPSADVGADLRATLTSDLTLNAAINPDFGQVEADQVILNLSNHELFFPEKRPFFNQGLDLFQPVGAEYGPPPAALLHAPDRPRHADPRRGQGDRARWTASTSASSTRSSWALRIPGRRTWPSWTIRIPTTPGSTRWRGIPTSGFSSTSSSRFTSGSTARFRASRRSRGTISQRWRARPSSATPPSG